MARRLKRGARPAGLAFAVALVSALVVSCLPPLALAARDLTDSSACESCLVAAHVLYDAIGDPYVETKMAQFLIDSICPNFADKTACEENVNNLVEALVEWMRVNLEPDALCASAGVCAPKPPPALAALAAAFSGNNNAHSAAQGSNGPKDITCPLCMFVLTKIKDTLSDPITREKVHDAGIKACAALPEGAGVRDACVDFVEKNEAQIYDFIDQTEPGQLCEKLNACPVVPPPPSASSSSSLSPAAAVVLQLAALAQRVVAGGELAVVSSSSPSSSSSPALALLARPMRALGADGNCDVCMAVVKDVHNAIASPDVQDQATALAKQACDALPSGGGGGAAADLAQRCRESVDQYAPLVFGMALAYLQPGTLCSQLGFCPVPPPPSPSSAAAAAVLAARSSAAADAADAEEMVAREVEAAVVSVAEVLGAVIGRAEAAFDQAVVLQQQEQQPQQQQQEEQEEEEEEEGEQPQQPQQEEQEPIAVAAT